MFEKFFADNSLENSLNRFISDLSKNSHDEKWLKELTRMFYFEVLAKTGGMCPKCYTSKKLWENRDRMSITVNLEQGASMNLLRKVGMDFSFYIDLKTLPEFCVYFLLKHGHVVYVGQTTSLIERIARHGREKDFDRVIVMECKDKDAMDETEAGYIELFNPELNIRKPNQPKVA